MYSKAKVTKRSHKSVERNTKLLELIHTIEGYFITFIDNFSKYTYVYLLKNKSDAI